MLYLNGKLQIHTKIKIELLELFKELIMHTFAGAIKK